LITVQLEPVGRWYESYCSRRHHQQSLSHGSLVSSSSDDEEVECILDEEDDAQLLASLDPKEWKVGRFCGYHFSGISENREMSGNSAKVREKSKKRPKVKERSENLCSPGNLIVAAQHLFFIRTVIFLIRDVHREYGLINVHLCNIFPAISSGKVMDFFLSGGAVFSKMLTDLEYCLSYCVEARSLCCVGPG